LLLRQQLVPTAALEFQRAADRTVPALNPVDHKDFFDKDNPYDARPHAGPELAFKYPYPHVAAETHYDNDFVKDENGDSGQWDAQMNYDAIRNKVRRKQDEIDAAAKKKSDAKEAVADAQRREQDADCAEYHAEHDEAQARRDERTAKDKVDDIMGKSGTGEDGEIGDATKEVSKEMADLEECKKQLADAQEKLKQLAAEKDGHDQDHADAGGDAASKAQEAELEASLAKEKAEHAEASRKYEQQLAWIESLKADLEEAKGRMEDARHEAKHPPRRGAPPAPSPDSPDAPDDSPDADAESKQSKRSGAESGAISRCLSGAAFYMAVFSAAAWL